MYSINFKIQNIRQNYKTIPDSISLSMAVFMPFAPYSVAILWQIVLH